MLHQNVLACCFWPTYVSLEKQENNGALCVDMELLFLGASSSEAALHLFRFWCMASPPHGPPPPSSLSHATKSNKDTRQQRSALKTGQSSRTLTQKTTEWGAETNQTVTVLQTFWKKSILLFRERALNWSKVTVKTFMNLQKILFKMQSCDNNVA